MTYTLEEFCTDCHTVLTEDPGAGGRRANPRTIGKSCW